MKLLNTLYHNPLPLHPCPTGAIGGFTYYLVSLKVEPRNMAPRVFFLQSYISFDITRVGYSPRLKWPKKLNAASLCGT